MAQARRVRERVAVLGGGVAGLSAAHELIERGFAVTVYELKSVPGGKARSVGVPGSGMPRNVGTVYQGRLRAARRKDLPGEHGFRFFPRFYKHVIDTMHRIPYAAGRTVDENLVETTRVDWARFDLPGVELVPHSPRNLSDLWTLLSNVGDVFGDDLGISPDEKAFFAQKTWQILTSCHERRADEYERIGWWEFVGAEQRSKAYQKFFGIGFTRQLVAARAEVASTKTVGDVYMNMLFGVLEPGISVDRVLNGPTNEVWIEPWLEYLRAAGVEYITDSAVRAINLVGGRVAGVTVEQQGRRVDVRADYYVSALPVEVMARLLTPEMLAAEPSLAGLVPLAQNVEWMNGCQFYLTQDVPITPGHVIYVDSPWALTSISQKQFWPDVDLSQYGDGKVRGIISVDISDWNQPGLLGKPARACTREEIKRDVWAQLKRSLNVAGRTLLRDEYVHDWFLDPDLDPPNATNLEPLLVNYVDSWRLRPKAVIGIPNLFLAADYVQTDTDLATMEGANEAARAAVNGLLALNGRTADACQMWALHDPPILEPWRAHDRARYTRGLAWDDSLVKVALKGFAAADMAGLSVTDRIDDVRALPETLKSLLPLISALWSRPDLLRSLEIDKLLRQLKDVYPLIGAYLERVAVAPPSSPATPPSSPAPESDPLSKQGRVRFVRW